MCSSRMCAGGTLPCASRCVTGTAEIVRMANKVETDADDCRKSAWRLIGVRNGAAFDQNAAGLGAIDENVVRPFEAQIRVGRELNGLAHGLDHGHPVTSESW